mgnify:CR=1 FL=1
MSAGTQTAAPRPRSLRAARPRAGFAAALLHRLSGIALALFLLVGRFATSTFFILTVMTLIDVMAGFVVTIVASRRDLAVGDAGV